jgi:hypothetical protein
MEILSKVSRVKTLIGRIVGKPEVEAVSLLTSD